MFKIQKLSLNMIQTRIAASEAFFKDIFDITMSIRDTCIREKIRQEIL